MTALRAKPTERAWTVAALAEKWSTDIDTLYGMLASGELKGFKVGRCWRISAEVVDRFENK